MSDYEIDHGTGAREATAGTTGVTLYRPIIVAILYLCGLFTVFTVLIGLILAYVWRNDEDVTEWEETHFTYLIRTFWIGFWVVVLMSIALIATAVALTTEPGFTDQMGIGGDPDNPPAAFVALMLGGMVIGFLLFIWSIVRSILSLANAANRRPMPNPKAWAF